MLSNSTRAPPSGSTDTVVDATARLVQSISTSSTASDSTNPNADTDARRLLPLARRILSSSVGAGGSGINATASIATGRTSSGSGSGSSTDARLVRRRLEKSYRRSLLSASSDGAAYEYGGSGDDPVHRQHVERDVQRTMAEVDTLQRRLANAEARHRAGMGGPEQGSTPFVADKVLMTLSRLVGTEGWEEKKPGSARTNEFVRPMNGTSSNGSASANPTTMRASSSAQQSSSSGAAAAEAEGLQSNKQSTVQTIEIRSVLHEEVLLLRDCLFALQGIDSERVKFYDFNATDRISDANGDAARDCPGVRVNPSLLPFQTTLSTQMDIKSRVLGSGSRDALRLCGEAGWLYRRVLAYVDGIRSSSSDGGAASNACRGGGAVARALTLALSEELADYHRLISVLEARLTSQISHSSAACDTSRNGGSEQVQQKLTVRQLMVHLRPAMCRLRTLATVADSLPNPATPDGSVCSGGKLITAIQQHSRHGDTRHSTLLHSLASKAAEPWFEVLWCWTTTGTLPVGSAIDSSSNRSTSVGRGREFFVAEDLSISDAQLWHGRFILLQDNVPLGVISMNLAERALILGKGINFIRLCLGEGRWELDLASLCSNQQETNKKASLGYRYDPATASSTGSINCHPGKTVRDERSNYANVLDMTISRMAEQVNSHILKSLRDKHHLQTHLWALKQFLLLGRGDFVSALLDGLHRELDPRSDDARRVGLGEMDGVYVHTLTSVVETALRTTNAKHLPSYVLARLKVELISDSSEVRPDAWDAFHLAYEVDAPLMAVVHPEAAELYRRVFTLLFRLARIVYMLNRTWRHSTALHHALRKLSLAYPDSPADARQRALLLLRRIALTRQSILHFASNLQSYLMFEVVEGGYETMATRAARATTLDEVIAAHDDYLSEIVRKSLLDHDDEEEGFDAAGRTGEGVDDSPTSTSASKPGGRSLGKELARVLDSSLRFCRVHSIMFERALKSVDTATRKRRAAERRALAGEWGYDSIDKDVDGTNLFNSLSDESQILEVESTADEFDLALSNLLMALDRTLDEGPPQVVVASRGVGVDGSGLPWWRRNGGVNGPPAWSNDDSLRFLAFRLDFNEYYDGRQEGTGVGVGIGIDTDAVPVEN